MTSGLSLVGDSGKAALCNCQLYEPRKASVVGFCRVPSEREANGHSGVDPSA